MRTHTIKRTYFDTIEEIQTLSDGTKVYEDDGVIYFLKTKEGLKYGDVLFPWHYFDCVEDYYIEYWEE